MLIKRSLEVSKSRIEDLFKDLVKEIKGFEYQIILAVLLSNIKTYGSIEHSNIRISIVSRNFVQNR